MKGVLKGFKYISTIFDEEEENDEIQIGLPTDVKHVAHIGMDGPSTESPSWMKDFSAERPKSAPLDSKGAPLDPSDDKTSTDTELTRTSRRRHSADSLAFDTTGALVAKTKGRKHHKKHPDGKSRARRHQRKNSSDQEGSSISSRASEDLNSNGEPTSPTSPTSGKLPDIPKKSRRKKVKDEISKLATKAKPKASSDGADVPPLPPSPAPLPPPSPAPLPPPATTDNTSRPPSDPGSASTESKPTITCDGESCQITLKPSPPKAEEKKSDKSDVVGVP